jgi:protein TonB
LCLHLWIALIAWRTAAQFGSGRPEAEAVTVEIIHALPATEPAAPVAASAPPAPAAAPAATVTPTPDTSIPLATRAPTPPAPTTRPRPAATISRQQRPKRTPPQREPTPAAKSELAAPAEGEAVTRSGGDAPAAAEPEAANGADERGASSKDEEGSSSRDGSLHATVETTRGDAAAPPGRAQLLEAYSRKVWSHIAAHRPKGLRLAGSTGVSFTLGRDGSLLHVAVARTSGNADLDGLALATLRTASPFPQPPPALHGPSLTFTIDFRFR